MLMHQVTVVLDFLDEDGNEEMLVFHLTTKYIPRVNDHLAFEASIIRDFEMRVTDVREKFFLGTESRIEVNAHGVRGPRHISKKLLAELLDRHEQVEIAEGERPNA
jgi:hypothetical protein